jgi:type IV fimbrial biogenesis protein FimT
MLIQGMPSGRGFARGFSIVELVIVIAILSILLLLGLPAMGEWLQNTQIRTGAEAVMHGLQLARAEAVRRNVPVRFQLVSSLDNTCGISASGPHWIVSRNEPTSACDQTPVIDFLEPNVATAPQILQVRSNAEGSPNVVFAATDDGAAFGVVTFNSVGRVMNGNGIDRIDIFNPYGACKADGGNMRCLRVLVSVGGDIKLCDPSIPVSAVGDTRKC